jgi:hypothetical protein
VTVRRYFDRNPGLETSVGDVTRIINNYTFVTEEAVSDEVRALLEQLSEQVGYVSQIFSNVSGTVTPTATDRAVIDVASTAGAWTLNLSNMPQTFPATVWVKIDSSGSHTPTFPATVVWDGGAPSSGLWAAGKRTVIRFTRVPTTNIIEGKVVFADDTPPIDDIGVVSPVSATFQYSTSSARTGLVNLSGATLPRGEVAIVIGPLSPDIAFVDIWHDLDGGL